MSDVRPPSALLSTLVLAVVVLAGCTDQALVDRVAQLERSDEQLRSSLTELGAPDTDAQEDRAAVRAELEAVAARITTVETDLEALTAALDTQVLELDGRITTLELQLDETRTELVQLQGALTALTDRVTSLDAQLTAHRDLSSHDG